MIKEFKLQPYNSKQLAAMYGVTYRVFMSWLKPLREDLGEQIGKMWSPKQVEIIIQDRGVPTHI